MVKKILLILCFAGIVFFVHNSRQSSVREYNQVLSAIPSLVNGGSISYDEYKILKLEIRYNREELIKDLKRKGLNEKDIDRILAIRPLIILQ